MSRQGDTYGSKQSGAGSLQLYATRGYAVLVPDLGGARSRPAADLAPLTLAAVDAAVAEGVADPARLGLMGHSDGGFAVLALLTQTDRFKAAISRSGYANLTSRQGMLDDNGAAYGIRAEKPVNEAGLTGPLTRQRDTFVAESPIFALDRIKTPLLLTHGTFDSACHSEQAEEVFTGLRELQRPVEYARYDREQHQERFWTHANQLDFLRRTLAWFDAHLQAKP
ncbi:MAG: S9 family peptidase [Verrucomicrobia bacterium]|nr:S9 family peptidase [Verrucomicrobiota bacterium]